MVVGRRDLDDVHPDKFDLTHDLAHRAARVLALTDRLRAAGVSLWIDQGGIDAASLWSQQIVAALESAKVLLLMITEAAAQSSNVAKEVMLFSERNGAILPVHLEPTVIPSTLRYQLAGIQHVEYYRDDGAEGALNTRGSSPPGSEAAARGRRGTPAP